MVLYGPGAATRDRVYTAFQQKYPGVEVQAVTMRGADMMARVTTEIASGQRVADVFLTGQTTMYAAKQADLFERWTPPNAEALPQQLRDPGGFYNAVNGAAYGILYNTNLVPPDQVPTAWRDLADPKWRGKILYYDPRSAGSGHTMMIEFSKTPDLGWPFVESLKGQNMVFIRDRQQGPQQVIQGAYPIFVPSDLQDFLELKKVNAPVGMNLTPREGMHFDISSIGVLKGAPHPNAAKLLINYMLGEEGQRVLAELGDYPARPDIPGPGGYPPWNELKILPLPDDADREKGDDYVRRIEEIFR